METCRDRGIFSASAEEQCNSYSILQMSDTPQAGRKNAERNHNGKFVLPILLSATTLVIASSCSEDVVDEASKTTTKSDWSSLPNVVNPEPELKGLPTRQQQFDRLCSMNRDDDFLTRVCVNPRPELTSLKELIELLGLNKDSAFALTANSTSLVKKSVSSVNPRAIIFPKVIVDNTPPEELNIISFVRGEPFVEIATRNSNGDYNFYLVVVEHPCDYDGTCDLASLFTEEIESGWSAYSIYPEEDLKDTPLDCTSCHQPGGHGTPTILRMQEFRSPWLHWFPQKFAQRTESDIVLLPRFLATHSVDEAYGGIPISTIETAVAEGSGAHLEELLRAEGQVEQPNSFDPLIERELADSGRSGRWDALYANFLEADAISVPYPGLDPSDPELRESVVQSYVDVVTGSAPRESLMNMHDLFTDEAREMLGIVPPADADGRTVLNVACGRCHDGRGDPSLVRSMFNVKALDQASREVKDRAIERLQLDPGSASIMPPKRFDPLPPEAIARAIQELQK